VAIYFREVDFLPYHIRARPLGLPVTVVALHLAAVTLNLFRGLAWAVACSMRPQNLSRLSVSTFPPPPLFQFLIVATHV
jgi:hypothetical protein